MKRSIEWRRRKNSIRFVPYARAAILLVAIVTAGCKGEQVGSSDGNGRAQTLFWSNPNSDKLAGDSTFRLNNELLLSSRTIKPDLELTLGDGSRGDKDSFGMIAGVAVDSDGRFYIWDSILLHVSVFDRSGMFVRYIGRPGEGPGEFNSPRGETNLNSGNGIAVSHDTVFVLDKFITAFDTSGHYLNASPREVDVWNAKRITATPAGLLLTEDKFKGADSLNYQFLTYTFRNELRTGFAVIEKLFISSADKNSVGPRVPLPTLPFASSENGLTYVVIGDSFHINAIDSDGRVHRTYMAAPSRVRITNADVKAQWNSIEKHYRETRAGRTKASLDNSIATIRGGFEGRPRALYREVINALIVSSEGDILLRRTDIAPHPYNWSDSTSAEWFLITATGRETARMQLPGSFMPKVMRNCFLYGVYQDRDGQDLVNRYRIPSATCAS